MSRNSWQQQPVYSFISWLLAPFVLIHLVWRSLHDGGLIYFKQRIGRATPALGNVIWIHAASVGEVNTAAPLIRAINASYPDKKIIVSTNTPTGKQAIDRQALSFAHSVYLPLDYSFAVKRFIRRNNIQCGIIIETEIWPKLLEYCSFPVVIANGRLSNRTLHATQGKYIGRILAGIYRRAVSHLDIVLARNDEDARGFAQLGVPDDRIQTVGNLKFAVMQATSPNMQRDKGTSDQQAPFNRPYCLLASTHEDEELQLSKQWIIQHRSELLVIAPRHPDRRIALIKQLETVTDTLSVRSRKDPIDDQTQIYLADTLGEMPLWYQHAAAIFIGGSLVPHGGHNFIEPAQYAQSVVIGPHTSNFKDEMHAFASVDAIVQVRSASSAMNALIELLDSPLLANERGERAQSVIKANDQIEKRYLAALAAVLDSSI